MTEMTAKGAKAAAGSDFLMEGFGQLKSSLVGNIFGIILFQANRILKFNHSPCKDRLIHP